MASNKWEKKFSSEQTEEQESTNLVAQRLINIFRQLHILNEDAVQKYNNMLLQASPDVIKYLPSLPGGEEVREYLSFIKDGNTVNISKEEKKTQEQIVSPQEQPATDKQVSTDSKAEQQPAAEPKKPIIVTEPPVSKSTQAFSPEVAQQMISAMMEVQQQAAQHQAEIISKALGQTQENLAHLMANTVSEIKGAQAQATAPGPQTESPLLENLAEAIKESQEQTNKTLLEILTKTQARAAESLPPSSGEVSETKETAQNSNLVNELLAAMAETQIKTAETQAKIIAEALAEAQETQKKLMEEQSFKLVREQAKVLAQAHHDAQELARQQLDVLSRNLIDAQEKFAQNPHPVYVGPVQNWIDPRNQTFASSQAMTHSINQSQKGFEIEYDLPSSNSGKTSFKEKYGKDYQEKYPSYERAAPPRAYREENSPVPGFIDHSGYQELKPAPDIQEYVPEENPAFAPDLEKEWQPTDIPQQNTEEEFTPAPEQNTNGPYEEYAPSFENEQNDGGEEQIPEGDWREIPEDSSFVSEEYGGENSFQEDNREGTSILSADSPEKEDFSYPQNGDYETNEEYPTQNSQETLEQDWHDADWTEQQPEEESEQNGQFQENPSFGEQISNEQDWPVDGEDYSVAVSPVSGDENYTEGNTVGDFSYEEIPAPAEEKENYDIREDASFDDSQHIENNHADDYEESMTESFSPVNNGATQNWENDNLPAEEERHIAGQTEETDKNGSFTEEKTYPQENFYPEGTENTETSFSNSQEFSDYPEGTFSETTEDIFSNYPAPEAVDEGFSDFSEEAEENGDSSQQNEQTNEIYTPFSLMQADTASLSLKEKQIITQVPPKPMAFEGNGGKASSYVSFDQPPKQGADPYASAVRRKRKK